MLNSRSTPVWRYGVAVIATGLATVVTILLHRYLSHGVMALFIASVMISAWVGGLGPGLLASVMSVLASQYFFFPPIYSLAVDSSDDIAQIVVFSIVTVLITSLTHAQKRSLQALVESQKRLQDYAEAVWDQQRRIASELHDSLGQELTGVGFLSKSLSQSLQGTEGSRLADQIKQGVERSLDQIRGMAKGVMPVELDGDGLMTALRELTTSVSSIHGLPCRFECPHPVVMDDHQLASHLYRIAQEAVTNSVKHASARNVTVTLIGGVVDVVLKVADDGKGMPDFSSQSPKGSGLKIMRYRAAAIGATLRIEKNPPGGTVISCVAPLHPRKSAAERLA